MQHCEKTASNYLTYAASMSVWWTMPLQDLVTSIFKLRSPTSLWGTYFWWYTVSTFLSSNKKYNGTTHTLVNFELPTRNVFYQKLLHVYTPVIWEVHIFQISNLFCQSSFLFSFRFLASVCNIHDTHYHLWSSWTGVRETICSSC